MSSSALWRWAARLGPVFRSVSIVEDFNKLADDVVLDDKQVAELSGYTVATLKVWRRRGLGPQYLIIHGRPRSTVGFVRAWLASLQRAS